MVEIFYKNRVFIIFSIIFLSFMIGNYMLNRSFAKEILVNEQINLLSASSNKIEKWIDGKKSSLNGISSLIQNQNIKDIEDILIKSSKIANFATVYVGYENGVTISSRFFNKPKNYIPKNRPWYINTINQDEIYITKPYIDVGLKVSVVSICQKVNNKNEIYGVLCGILTLKEIKNQISNLPMENGSKIFLIDENHNILYDEKNETKIFDLDLDLYKKLGYETSDEIITIKPIENSKLILVAKTPKKNIYNKINEQFIINFIIYIFSILLFLLLVVIYNKISKSKDEIINKTNKMLEMFVENSEKGILILTAKKEIVFYNKRLFEILNSEFESYDEFIKILPLKPAKKILDFMHNPSYSLNSKSSFRFIYDIKESYFEIQILHIFTNSNYEGAILFLDDISEKYRFEEYKKEHERMLFAQTKMAELGQMISAISHQWAQPLNALSVFLGNLMQFKKMRKLNDEIFYDNLNRSLKNIDYMSKTMHMFKNFYRFEDKKQIFDVKKAIEDTIFILFSQNSKINIKVTFDKNIKLKCNNYLNDFTQIIACLIQNSKQALEQVQFPKIVISIKAENGFFLISVIDNGIGLKSETLEQIFTPFFSTKKSSGLGLYISKLMAHKKCGGDLKVLKPKNPTVFLLKISDGFKDDK
ncbi:Cache sensor-containing two-component system histidine kinase [Campylobacter blaseri]|uniref:histidine kinase n=1 Tax=Campylobacter blaseri TaxID=2042961 RepID=A0A2P8QZX6_9BACT|nr:sensor histidine kinase [Campylobacter blaseri]PSM51790.1 histidine kinase [Campylobacter blaseri]PSM53581.1 histidine kinase [Campylobacter blaseri]QKF86392.1 Cache sensor-containing two-component system histidine kinase [Campylobacter blaseri]